MKLTEILLEAETPIKLEDVWKCFCDAVKPYRSKEWMSDWIKKNNEYVNKYDSDGWTRISSDRPNVVVITGIPCEPEVIDKAFKSKFGKKYNSELTARSSYFGTTTYFFNVEPELKRHTANLEKEIESVIKALSSCGLGRPSKKANNRKVEYTVLNSEKEGFVLTYEADGDGKIVMATIDGAFHKDTVKKSYKMWDKLYGLVKKGIDAPDDGNKWSYDFGKFAFVSEYIPKWCKIKDRANSQGMCVKIKRK